MSTPETTPTTRTRSVKDTRMTDPRHLEAVTEEHKPRWTPAYWRADDLMATDFPEPQWAVPGLLCEGVTILGGPPKVGKSWLSLSLALDIAAGADALGSVPVEQGSVLYMALEDTPRRLKKRMGQLLPNTSAPNDLHLVTEWPPMSTPEGAIHLNQWLTEVVRPRLVVMDVFAKIRGPVPQGMSAYDADYAAVGRIKRIADAHAVPIVLVHHVRKAGNDDFLQEISGTNGIAGSADATLVLKRARGSADGQLHITGRDVEEDTWAMEHIKDTGRWHRLPGDPEDYQLGDTRAQIVAFLRKSPHTSPKGVAEATGLNYENTRRTMSRMAEAGQLLAGVGGTYSTP